MSWQREDLTDKKFSELTAISFVRSDKYGTSFWKFKCDCGKVKIIRANAVKAGKTRSCGCYQRSHRLSNNDIGINRIFSDYKYNANKRKISFCLTKKELRYIISKPCFYCKTINSNHKIKYYGHRRVEYRYNGIDRLDSSSGYTKENVVSCCSICNYMKKQMSYIDFVNHIKKIAKNLTFPNLSQGDIT